MTEKVLRHRTSDANFVAQVLKEVKEYYKGYSTLNKRELRILKFTSKVARNLILEEVEKEITNLNSEKWTRGDYAALWTLKKRLRVPSVGMKKFVYKEALLHGIRHRREKKND